MRRNKSLYFVIISLCAWISSAKEGIHEDCRASHCDDEAMDRDVIYDNAKDKLDDFEGGGTTLCLPDKYGYIGETSSAPHIITYAFGLESDTYVEVLDILRAVKISLEDFLISYFFPEDCIHARKLDPADLEIEGFHFETEIDLMSVSCTPSLPSDVTCGIYEGFITVYGSRNSIISLKVMMQDHLDDKDTKSIHPEIMRLFAAVTSNPVINTTQIESEIPFPESLKSVVSNSNETSDGKSIAATIGIAVATSLLLIGIIVLIYYQYKHRKKGMYAVYENSHCANQLYTSQSSSDNYDVHTDGSATGHVI